MFSALGNLLSAWYASTEPARDRLRSEDGLETVEWALLAALVAVVIIGAVNLLNPAMGNAFTALGNGVQAAANAFNTAAN
jgi:Flp pilus assembly pilin Flp